MLRKELTSAQITEWMAYERLEPFGAHSLRNWGVQMIGGLANLLHLRGGPPKMPSEPYMTEDVFGGLKALFGKKDKQNGRP